MRPIVLTKVTELAASPREVWPFIADTDRTNRAVGANPVFYSPIERGRPGPPTSARFVAQTKLSAFDLTYEELPFEWEEGRGLRVVRTMRGGALETYTMVWKIADSAVRPGGAQVTIELELVARTPLLRPLVWLSAWSMLRRLGEFVESIDAHVKQGAASPFRGAPPELDEALLTRGGAALVKSGVRETLASRLALMLREASDADLSHIRPFEVADTLFEDRTEVLGAMLYGVSAGLFDLRWAIVCPSCRGATTLLPSLDDVTEEGHCQLCDVTFELSLDRAVEATFIPHEAVRKVSSVPYCIAGPARSAHVFAQLNIAPGECRALPAPEVPGRYRLFARGGATATIDVDARGEPTVELTVTEEGMRTPGVSVAPGGNVAITNATAEARHVKLERLGYASDAATAHHLSLLPEFRRLFSSHLLKRGMPLKVSRVAILFSDLTGSTALYARVGDAAAFRLVDDHFDLMREAFGPNHGVIVKTMGDAVMAAFGDPRDCMVAAARALELFERFRSSREYGQFVGLKLGAALGPCYVVTANGALDYFGQTVNIASRVQHLAEPGEIVLPEELFLTLHDETLPLLSLAEHFQAEVKGVSETLSLVRLRLSTPAQGQRPQVRTTDVTLPPVARGVV